MGKFITCAVGGLVMTGAATVAIRAAVPATISGAGASFPAPLYAAWAAAYRTQTGQQVNYQAIGSGGGIKQIKAGTIDVGATDRPLTPTELATADLYQFPTVIGGIVPIVNLPGLRDGRLKLDGRALAAIFLGRITRWNDVALQRANPQLRLPPVPITVVHRADGSGTSFLFTSFLAGADRDWAGKVGAGEAVAWPTGLGGKGNDGVGAFVKQTIGAIGYVEYAYARQSSIAAARVCNRARRCPPPGTASFAAAAAAAPWAGAAGNDVLLLDRPEADAWPIAGATFILMRRRQTNQATGAAVLRFFDWAYRSGDAAALRLAYVPLPASVKALVRAQWPAAITTGGLAVYTPRGDMPQP